MRKREVKEIIKKEIRINKLLIKVRLIIISNIYLQFIIDNIGRIPIEKKE